MSNRICGRCKSSVVVPWNNVKDFYKCMNCSAMGYTEKFPEKTVFDQITQSPEVLAEKLVYHGVTSWDDEFYASTICNEIYKTRAEAIAATVAMLKEVEK